MIILRENKKMGNSWAVSHTFNPSRKQADRSMNLAWFTEKSSSTAKVTYINPVLKSQKGRGGEGKGKKVGR